MRWVLFFWAMRGFAIFNLTWGMPALNLDSNPPIGDTDSNASIALDAKGNAIASWSRTTEAAASEKIWVTLYNHSLRTWTGAVQVSKEGAAANSQVAMDPLGNAMIVWEEGFPSRIKYRILSKEGVWTPDLSMPACDVYPSIHAQTYPQIAIDSSNRTIVVWMELIRGKEQVMSSVNFQGSLWVHFGNISSGEKSALLIPQKSLALNNSSGMAMAVWEERDRETSEIHAAQFTGGIWMPSFPVANIPGEEACSPSVAIDHEGNVVVVWSQNHQIRSKILQNGQLSEENSTLSHPNYTAIHPHVGIDGNGNAIVVYERMDTMHKFISGAFLPKGAANWSHPIDISSQSPIYAMVAGYPVLSVNEIGDAVVIWKEFTDGHIVIQGAGYSLGTWSNTKTLSSLTGNSGSKIPAYDSSVVLNNNGTILAIWPEDPAGTGSFQIKSTAGVGLAAIGPLPPVAHPDTYILGGIASGKQIRHRFPAHEDLINVLTWTSPAEVYRFHIYRENLSTLIASVDTHFYEDHQRTPKEPVKYLITSVNAYGQESCPMTLVVPPL